jgi:hypothetical protein
VIVLDAPREMVLVLPPGRLAWTWRFTVDALDHGRSRLTITTELSFFARGRLARAATRAAFAVFDVGHGVMEGVQLRTLARRVPATR